MSRHARNKGIQRVTCGVLIPVTTVQHRPRFQAARRRRHWGPNSHFPGPSPVSSAIAPTSEVDRVLETWLGIYRHDLSRIRCGAVREAAAPACHLSIREDF